MAAIFGPSSPYTYGIVASIAARFDVPHMDYFWRQNEELQEGQEPKNPTPMTINVFPDSNMVSKVSENRSVGVGRAEVNCCLMTWNIFSSKN